MILSLMVLLPLLGAAVATALPRFGRPAAALAAGATATCAALVAVEAAEVGRVVVRVGGHAPPLGIVLVGDVLTGVAGTVAALVVLAVAVGLPSRGWWGTPAVLGVLSTGVQWSFATGDLFTMFVAFELVLIASYVLLVRGGSERGLRVAPTAIAVNLVASTLFLVALGTVYAATGTVTLADLARQWPELPTGLQAGAGGLLLAVFSVKAGVVPTATWLPAAYGSVPPVLGAAFGALLTKVGIVAMLRVLPLLPPTADVRGPVLTAAGLTMLGGVVVALGQTQVHRILAAHVVSQVGFLVLGIGLGGTDGTAGTIAYLAHHVLVKAALFVAVGAVVARVGSTSLDDWSGIARRQPAAAAAFGIAALALAGIPPTSGFVVKLALVDAGLADGAYVAVAAAVLASFLTLVSMSKIWVKGFWGAPLSDTAASDVGRLDATRATLAAGGLVVASLVVAAGAGGLFTISRVGAQQLADVDGYVATVLPPSGGAP